MRQLVLLYLLTGIIACNSKKDKIIYPVSGNDLLFVADGGSKKDFSELIRKTRFRITDSSFGRLSGIEFVSYSAEDSLKPPSILEVNINKDLDVIYLSFRTNNKENFLQIKHDFIDAGFKVQKKVNSIEGLAKENNSVDIIMMDFEKTSKSFTIALGRKIDD